MIRLTTAQKRELELLKTVGGCRQIYSYRLMKIYWTLQEKGYVDCISAFGQFEKGITVSLK